MKPSALGLALLLAGCGAEASIDAFDLQLNPVVPDGHDPFRQGARLLLGVEREGGPELFDLGARADNTWQTDPLDALEGSAIDLWLTQGTRTVGAGRSAPVQHREGSAEVNVLITEPGRPADITGLTTLERSYLAATALLPSGDVFLFGGTPDIAATAVGGHNHVLRWSRANPRGGFARQGDMPTPGTASAVRIGATATPIQIEGEARVLVFGGRPQFGTLNGAQRTGFLWDPEAGRALSTVVTASRGRSQHVAVQVPGGDVLMLGGWSDDGQANSFTIDRYRPSTQTFVANSVSFETLNVGPVGFGWALIGDRLILCGGAATSGPGTHLPRSQCAALAIGTDSLTVQTLSDLPTTGTVAGRAWHAMTPLVDTGGGAEVLLTGGTHGTVTPTENGDALDDAWIYNLDADTWTRTADLDEPRAMHRMVLRPDGDVLLIGGTRGAALPVAIARPEPLDCPSRFDATAGIFVDATPCAAGFSGASPSVALDPDHGLVVLQGLMDGGGTAVGVTSLSAAPAR